MPTLFAFRLSTYLTLATAVLCVAYSEWDILRQASYFGVVVLLLLAVAFWCEGRYELDLSAANRLGFVIGIGAAAWIAMQFVNRSSLIYTLPWPTSLLPYLGPLVMVLMPAKLFRPKHTGDWWAMQGIGLAAAGLASIMADDAVFVGLLAVYAVAGVWSLSLFYYLRVGGALPPVPHTDPGPVPAILASEVQFDRVHFGGRFLAQTVAWVAVALGMALPLFFLTPRSTAPRWQFGEQPLEVGLSATQSVDLNKSGELQETDAVAYELVVRGLTGLPVAGLPADQRFRYYTFASYEAGRWQKLTGSKQLPIFQRGAALPLLNIPPNFGPGQLELTFVQTEYAPAPVLADPVAWGVNRPPPVYTLSNGELWFQTYDGSFFPHTVSQSRQPFSPYRQVVAFNTPPDRDLGPPFELTVPFHAAGESASPDNPLELLRLARLPRIHAWSRSLFERLGQTDAAIADCLKRATREPQFQFAPEDYETVARHLAAYFNTSSDYRYTMKLRRLDLTVDPVEEFLVSTKEGHCERFAAATALILRAVGVPTQYVLGYKGVENAATPGLYTIRQQHAHAWVDVLVPRPAPRGFAFEKRENSTLNGKPVVWHWLSVDPTPTTDSPDLEPGKPGIRGAAEDVRRFLSDFVIGYDADRRDTSVREFGQWVVFGKGRVVLAVIALTSAFLATVLVLRVRRKQFRPKPSSGFAWYDRYTGLITGWKLATEAGATPREVAASVDRITGGTEASDLAARYYLARYAGRPPSPEESAQLDQLVAELAARRLASVRKA